MTDRTPPLDYEAVKDFFYNKLSQDRQGRGRMESAIFHTVQHVYTIGCHRADEVATENARLLDRIRKLEAELADVSARSIRRGGIIDGLHEQLTAEREVSDKLVTALKWFAEQEPVLRGAVGTLLAEVAALRRRRDDGERAQRPGDTGGDESGLEPAVALVTRRDQGHDPDADGEDRNG